MARPNVLADRAIVLAKLAELGGEVKHNDLIDALEEDGNVMATRQIMPMLQSKELVPQLRAVSEGKPAELFLTAGGGS